MTDRPALLALGRSRLLFDSVSHLAAKGYEFAGIVTAPANDEYDVGVDDFELLAGRLGSQFVVTRSVDDPTVLRLVEERKVGACISVNWQYLVGPSFLDRFPLGVLNLHVGDLPDYKGNATINWAILNGLEAVHADVHRMTVDLDAGDVLARHRIPLGPNTYVGDVLDETTTRAPQLFEQALESLRADAAARVVAGSRDGTRCYPRIPDDGRIDWSAPAVQVARLVRASSHPYPGAFTYLGARRVVVWRARVAPAADVIAMPGHVLGAAGDALRVACGSGALDLEEVTVDGESIAASGLTRSIRARHTAYPPA